MASTNYKKLPESRTLADPVEWSRFGMQVHRSKHLNKTREHRKEGLCVQQRNERSGHWQMMGNGWFSGKNQAEYKK